MDASVREVFGAEAVNASKREAEGDPAPIQIVWGITMDFARERSVLPEPKAMKMRYLLAEPELRFGSRSVRMRTARELSGLGQFCSGAAPQLGLELPAVHRMLGGDAGQAYVSPAGDPAQVEAAW